LHLALFLPKKQLGISRKEQGAQRFRGFFFVILAFSAANTTAEKYMD
jgi:hypothetical protein